MFGFKKNKVSPTIKALLDAIYNKLPAKTHEDHWSLRWDAHKEALALYKNLETPEQRVDFIFSFLDISQRMGYMEDHDYPKEVINEFLKKQHSFSSSQLVCLYDHLNHEHVIQPSLAGLERQIRALKEREGSLSEEVRDIVEAVIEFYDQWALDIKTPVGGFNKIQRTIYFNYKDLLGESASKNGFDDNERDQFLTSILDYINTLTPSKKDAWLSLLVFAKQFNGSKPNKKFENYIKEVGLDDKDTAQEFFYVLEHFYKIYVTKKIFSDADIQNIRQECRDTIERYREYNFYTDSDEDRLVNAAIQQKTYTDPLDQTRSIVRCLLWWAARFDHPLTSALVRDLALASFKKIPEVGSRDAKLGNACLYYLANIPGKDGVVVLMQLHNKIKAPGIRQTIESSIDKVALRLGISRTELEDQSIPTYGFSMDGVRREAFDDCACIVTLKNSGVDMVFQNDGRVCKTLPAKVKAEHSDLIKEIRATKKEVGVALAVIKNRLEQVYLSPRSWSKEDWENAYMRHPLFRHIATNLIWSIDLPGRNMSLIVDSDGRLKNQDGVVEQIPQDGVVTLWHPINASFEDIMAWRKYCIDHRLVQPIKQAFREVYLLSDDEKKTETYSNRFAARILRQYQFNVLCGQRNWKYSLQSLQWDGLNDAYVVLSRWGIRAEYLVQPIEDDSDRGVNTFISTDQVRFLKGNSLLALTEVPLLVFSEIMRDVDLFASVASVAVDTDWTDNQRQWEQYAYGDLSERGNMRKSVLEYIIPRLDIASSCAIQGNYLTVQGTKHIYKIHIGTAQIIMDEDKPLCIVRSNRKPDRSTDRIYLPFQDDLILSEILSKAMLLAHDDAITEASILAKL